MASMISIDEALARLADSQAVLTKWTAAVNAKIYELETSYLEETPQGNLVKGWEMEGRPPCALEHKHRKMPVGPWQSAQSVA